MKLLLSCLHLKRNLFFFVLGRSIAFIYVKNLQRIPENLLNFPSYVKKKKDLLKNTFRRNNFSKIKKENPQLKIFLKYLPFNNGTVFASLSEDT